MSISIYTIDTVMGNLTNANQLAQFMSPDELKELDTIGYTGKTEDGVPTSREKYLNSLGYGEFAVKQTKFDNGNFSESFTIVHVSQ